MLRELSYALEITLQELQPPAPHLHGAQHDLFDFTIERVRQMLQIFATGELPPEQPELIEALHKLRDALAHPPEVGEALDERLDSIVGEPGGEQLEERLDNLFSDTYHSLVTEPPAAAESTQQPTPAVAAQEGNIDNLFDAAFDDAFDAPELTQAAPEAVEQFAADTSAPVMEEITAPVVEEITAPVAEEIIAPEVEEIIAPEVEEIAAPVVEEIIAPVVEEIAAPAVEETLRRWSKKSWRRWWKKSLHRWLPKPKPNQSRLPKRLKQQCCWLKLKLKPLAPKPQSKSTPSMPPHWPPAKPSKKKRSTWTTQPQAKCRSSSCRKPRTCSVPARPTFTTSWIRTCCRYS